MKKLISMLMALALACSVVTVSAVAAIADTQVTYSASTTEKNTSKAGVEAGAVTSTVGTGSVEVKMQASKDISVTHVYAVSYSATELTYEYNSALIWNPDTLQYEFSTDASEGSWVDNTKTITITNYSDLAIAVSATDPSTTNNVTVTTTVKNSIIGAAYTDNDFGATGTATTGTVEIAVSGTPQALEAQTIGNVTITISKSVG